MSRRSKTRLARAQRRAMALPRRRQSQRWGAPEKRTVALGVLALATIAGVAITEFGRVFRRAAEQTPADTGVFETAGLATRDTVAVAREGYERAARRENALFNLLSAFVVAFAYARISTWGIRAGWGPFRNVRLGGRHIHHFLPGMLVAFGAGGVALVTRNDKLEPLLAIPFGIGVGLTFDEFALLLDLEDVYWTREGLVSVQISLGLVALLGATLLALRIIRRGEAVVLESPSWAVRAA